MTIRPYVPADWELYRAWAVCRSAAYDLPEYLPPTGLVADEMAMGWLLKTDSACAFVENLITDPTAPVVARGHAARAVSATLMSMARAAGFKSVCILTSRDSVRSLAKSLASVTVSDVAMLETRF